MSEKSPRLGLAHLTIEEATPDELVGAAADAGFSVVGMRICGFAPDADHVRLLSERARQRELRRRLDDVDISLLNVCNFRLTRDIQPADYAPVIAACVELGAPLILLTCFIDDEGERAAKLSSLAAIANEAGIAIGLEFFRSSGLRSLEAAEALRRSCDSQNVGHVLGALHVFRAGHQPADLAALDPRHVLGIQICGFRRKSGAGMRK